MRHLGQRHLQDAAVGRDLLRLEPAEEGAQRGHGPCERAAGNAGAAARGHEGAKAPNIEPGEIGQAGGVAEVGLQPGEELGEVAAVGVERVVRGAALVLEIGEPRLDGAPQVLAERQAAVLEDRLQVGAAHVLQPLFRREPDHHAT